MDHLSDERSPAKPPQTYSVGPEGIDEDIVSSQGMDVEQKSPRGVCLIGVIGLAPGQLGQEPGVHRAEVHLAGLDALPQQGLVLEQPGQFGPRKIGVDDETGAGPHLRFDAGPPEAFADGYGAFALPNHGLAQGFAVGVS